MMRVLAQPAFRNRGANPYQWLLHRELDVLGVTVEEFSLAALEAHPPAVCHLHWPEFVGPRGRGVVGPTARGMRLLRALDRARQRGTRVVWTVHNLNGHDRGATFADAWFWPRFTRRLDGWISMSEAGQQAALAQLPGLHDATGAVIPHGHYRGAYPDDVDRAQARRGLGIDDAAFVIAFVGQIRAYKNVHALVAAFEGYGDADAVLLVAGKPSAPSVAEGLRDAAAADPRVWLSLGFVPDDAVQLHLRAADVVVLPYRAVLNSGAALLALSFDRPVVVPPAPPLVELRSEVGPAWVMTYDGGITPDLLAEIRQWVGSDERTTPELRARDWPDVARRTRDLYATLVGTPVEGAPA